jgi:hypothetical protein
MNVRPQIPAIQGVKDPQVAGILGAMKSIIDRVTGRTPNTPQIATLGQDAGLTGVINKVNEIVNRLQDADSGKSRVQHLPVSSAILVVNRDVSAASGSVSYVGVGFKPSSLIAISAGAGGPLNFMVAMADSSKSTANIVFYANAGTTSNTGFIGLEQNDSSDANKQTSTLTSYDADGFTLAWTKSGAPAALVHISYVLCFR